MPNDVGGDRCLVCGRPDAKPRVLSPLGFYCDVCARKRWRHQCLSESGQRFREAIAEQGHEFTSEELRESLDEAIGRVSARKVKGV